MIFGSKDMLTRSFSFCPLLKPSFLHFFSKSRLRTLLKKFSTVGEASTSCENFFITNLPFDETLVEDKANFEKIFFSVRGRCVFDTRVHACVYGNRAESWMDRIFWLWRATVSAGWEVASWFLLCKVLSSMGFQMGQVLVGVDCGKMSKKGAKGPKVR